MAEAEVMRWFTREWHTGALSDEEWDRRRRDYAAHAEALGLALADDQRWLLDLDLHDAQVQSYRVEAGLFGWTLLTGDRQRGYRFTTITYTGAELVGLRASDLEELAFADRSELLSNEVDQVGNALEHRFLFHPFGQFAVRFAQAAVHYQPADARSRR